MLIHEHFFLRISLIYNMYSGGAFMLYYQPSCSLNEMDSVSSAFFREYAKKHEMKIRACCRFDKKLPAEEDTALYFCQTCREVMESQGIHTKSMWEYIDEDPDYVFPDYSGMKFIIQDCWRDREHPEIHKAVRSLLSKMHIEYLEIPKSREDSDYCGTLHFETEKYRNDIPSFDHLSHYGDEMTKKLMEEKASQMNGIPVITCCARCCKGLVLGGADAIHLTWLLSDAYRGREQELHNRIIAINSRPDPRYKQKQH